VQLIGGLRAGLGYCGTRTLEDLKTRGRFMMVTAAALRESHPHDVIITKEAPKLSRELGSMSWHGQINRTIWEINEALKKSPESPRQRRELLRAQFLQNFEYDKAFHVPRDDRSFLFLHDTDAPIVLLLHGSTGTPAEMRDLGNHLYANGVSAYCPRLRRTNGHDVPTSWEGWVSQAQIAIEIVTTCSPAAFVCGLSLGATVALILADRAPVKGLILLAPALYRA